MSFLKSIHISGYRGFCTPGEGVAFAIPKKGDIGSGLTIITGANNSGKSTVIEAIRARSGSQAPSFSRSHRNASTDLVVIEYEFEEEQPMGADGRPCGPITSNEVIRSKCKGSSQSIHTIDGNEVTDRSKLGSTLIQVIPSRRGFSPYFSRADATLQDYQGNGAAGLPAKRVAQLSNFHMRLFDIEKNPEKFNLLLAEILGFLPEWTIDQSEEGSYYIRLRNGQATHSSDGVGEGIVSLFSIVDALTNTPKDSIVAIDEPELSLHPAITRRLVSAIVRLSAEKQIIVCTHSPYFVDPQAIANGAALVRVVSENGSAKVHQLGKEGRKSLAKIHNTKRPSTRTPHTFGLDARELFFLDDGIVLTEGQDDVILYPVVAQQLGMKCVPGHLFGWGVGGAGNMGNFSQLLKDMGYRKVAGILDSDQAGTLQELQRDFQEYKFFLIPAKDVRDKDATAAREEVQGLLEKGKKLRDAHRKPMQEIFDSINKFFGTTEEATPQSPDQ